MPTATPVGTIRRETHPAEVEVHKKGHEGPGYTIWVLTAGPGGARSWVRVHTVELEGGDGAAVLDAGPEEREPRDLAQALDGVADDVARVLPDRVHADAGEEVHGGTEADRLNKELLEGLRQLGADPVEEQG